MRFNKKERLVIDRVKRNWKIMMKNFILSFETGSSILGFVMGQFVWIWILKGFLGWFVMWFCEVTQYQILDVWRLIHLFWIMYGVWFFISIIIRLRLEKSTTISEGVGK